jgi:uncharacterized protein (TIGR02246 family)
MKPLIGWTLMIGALLAVGSLSIGNPHAQRADPNLAAVAAIMKADADFNQAVADRNLSRFLSFIAEGATFNGGTPDEIRGRDAIAKDWAPFFETAGPRLMWKPTKAEVLGAGDLGYSVGTSEFRSTAGSQATVRRGNYLTVWRKQVDGAWRVVYDTGSTFKP